MNLIKYKKIEFLLNNSIIGTVYDSTLPDSIEKMKHLNIINNVKIIISCYY